MKYLNTRFQQRIVIGILAAGFELIGRYIFPNWDVNYLVYGARFYIDNQAPWMDVWMGIDTINGMIATVLNSPELAITAIGLLLAVSVTLAVDEIFVQLRMSSQARITAILGTALFFKPTVGGWISDHLSYAAGIAPGLLFVFKRFKITKTVAIVSGSCLALGVTLKLNSFITTYSFCLAWIGLYFLLQKLKSKQSFENKRHVKAFIYFVISAILTGVLMTWLVGIGPSLYVKIFNTYKSAAGSTAGGQFAMDRFLRVPLQIDIIEAVKQQSLGVIIFLPFVVLFWISLVRSIYILSREPDENQLKQHWTSLFLLISTSIVCYSLGRGLSHRLFLLPAGIILSLEGLQLSKSFYRGFLLMLASYFTFTWSSLAWAQRDLERNRPYNSRIYLNQNPQLQKLCLEDISRQNHVDYLKYAKSGVLPIKAASRQSNNSKSKCWSSKEAYDQIAGFMHVQEPANALGFSFKNDLAGGGDYFEKWDAEKRDPSYRKKWVIAKANWINTNQYPYFFERIKIMPEEYSVPGYIENSIPRERQLEYLVKLTDAKLIGSIGDVMLWETRWGRKH